MKRSLPSYVYPKRSRSGTIYHYFIRGPISVRIDPGAPDFWTQYARLKESDVKPIITGKRTISKLIASYKASDKFAEKKPRTQADYTRVMARIETSLGAIDPKDVQPSDVYRWQAGLEGRFAQYFVQVLHVIMLHAVKIGWRNDSPCKGVELKKIIRKAPHVVWTDDAIKAFRAGAKPLALAIFETGLSSAQRPDDWTRFDWEHIRDGVLHLTQSKTGKRLVIPLGAGALAALAAIDTGVRRINGKTPLFTARGRRLTYKLMAALMLAERVRLGVQMHDLHALRYRAVMELAMSGQTDEFIMSVSGHGTKAMVEKYAGEARQIMRAKIAQAKRGA